MAPLEMGLTDDLDGYRWCSHRAYLGLESIDWLHQAPVRELLGPPPQGEANDPTTAATAAADIPMTGKAAAGDLAQQDYEQFMSAHRAGDDAAAGDAPPRSHSPSDDQFFSWLRRHAGKPPASVTVDQVIQAVAKKMGVDRKRLLSTSRERRLTLTRALIGWHVTKNQIATLTEVSRQLGRDPSSVYTAYARYRAWRPQLFRDSLATILQYLENDEASTIKKH
jgi:hypothetical protein